MDYTQSLMISGRNLNGGLITEDYVVDLVGDGRERNYSCDVIELTEDMLECKPSADIVVPESTKLLNLDLQV